MKLLFKKFSPTAVNQNIFLGILSQTLLAYVLPLTSEIKFQSHTKQVKLEFL